MPTWTLRYDLRCPPFSKASPAELYATALEQCAWADRLGFSGVILSEHHGSPDGYLPSPLVFGAAVAPAEHRASARPALIDARDGAIARERSRRWRRSARAGRARLLAGGYRSPEDEGRRQVAVGRAVVLREDHPREAEAVAQAHCSSAVA